MGVVPPDQVDVARQALTNGTTTSGNLDGIMAQLVDGGLLVPTDMNEERVANDSYIQRYTDRSLRLIVMPTGQCNFRCVYCYESFLRGKWQRRFKRASDATSIATIWMS
jgi:uncharacterized protein